MLIGISGHKQVGKNTVSSMMQHEFKQLGITFELKSYAYKLKQILSLLTGIPIEWMELEDKKNIMIGLDWIKDDSIMTIRQSLQYIGTDLLRNQFHPDVWVNALFNDRTLGDLIIITDVRFPNEVKAIRDRGGIVIRVVKPQLNKDEHESETALDNAVFDKYILNDGSLDELQQQVKQLVNEIIEENPQLLQTA